MYPRDIKLLKLNGWEIECESPFEIRHSDGSFARDQAANIVLESLHSSQKRLKNQCPNCHIAGVLNYNSDEDTILCTNCSFALMKDGEDFISVIEKMLHIISHGIR